MRSHRKWASILTPGFALDALVQLIPATTSTQFDTDRELVTGL